MWSYHLCDSITGEKLLEIQPDSGSWASSLNRPDGGSHVFKLADLRIKRETMWNLTTPWARTLVQCWNKQPRYAGLVSGRPYDWGTKQLTLTHTDVRSIFLARYPFGVGSYWADLAETIPGRLVLSGLSLRAIAANVVEQGLLGPTSKYALPIVLPSRTEAGPHSLTVENFNFRKVADLLDEIQRMDGGPDIEFAPRWSTSDRLEWVMRAGSPAAPALTGNEFEFNLSAEESKIASFTIAEDAQKQVTGVFGLGEGSGADKIVGGTPGLSVADIPARDEAISFSMAKTRPDAASLASEYLKAHRGSSVVSSLSVRTTDVDPNRLVLGSTISIFDKGDWWNADGWVKYRLIGLSGDMGETMKLAVMGNR